MKARKVFLLCLLLLLLSTAAHAKIVFSSKRDGVVGVYVMDDDGSNQTLLTESETLYPLPQSWSPDGKHILFKRSVRINGGDVLFLMNPDGTNIRQLTEDDGSTINRASFSPDGQFIVFKRSFHKNLAFKFGTYVLNIETRTMKKYRISGGTSMIGP